MSTVAWIIIGILVLIIIVLVVAVATAVKFAGDMFAGVITACGGPDIRKKRKR